MQITPECIAKLTEIENNAWQQIGTAACSAFGGEVNFSNPLVVSAKTEDIVSELPGPMLAMHFSFASSPSNEQLILFAPQFAKELASLVTKLPVEELDDETLNATKAAFSAIVEALCEVHGNIRNEVESVERFSIVKEIIQLPASMQSVPDLVRSQVTMTAGQFSGTLIWLCDERIANSFLIDPTLALRDTFVPEHDAPVSRVAAELDVIRDIPLQVSVELGRVSMLVQDVVELGSGSIVEIDKAAGDPVDVLVNGLPVARGEVVVIEDNFGVRITEILTPKERLNRLGDAA